MASRANLLQQAAVSTRLKNTPLHEALAEQIREAQETYGSTVRSGKAAAQFTAQAAARAQPTIQQAYGSASGAQARLNSQALSALPSSGVNDAFKADQSSEVTQMLSQLLSGRANALARNAQVPVAAAEGAQFGELNARSTLQKQLRTLLAKGQSLSASQGAETQAEADKLQHEAESNEQQERSSERSANTSTANAQLGASTSEANNKRSTATSEANSRRSAAGKNAGPGGVTQQGTTQQAKAATTLRQIEGEARNLRAQGHHPGDILASLTSALPAGKTNVRKTTIDPKTGKPRYLNKTDGTPEYESVTEPAVAAHDKLLTEAAIDSVFNYGKVSRATLQKLHNNGYSIKILNLAPPAPSRPAGPSGRGAESNAGRGEARRRR